MAYTDREDLNYVGELFLIGANQTPFLNMIGGVEGIRSKQYPSFLFPIAQPWALADASQPEITEDASRTGQQPVTVTRGQDYNTVQIFQEAVEVSYAKQSTFGEFSGIQITAGQPVKDELTFQKSARLLQISKDVDYSMLNGVYQLASAGTVAAKTKGVITAMSTNSIDAESATFEKAMLDELLQEMAEHGAVFDNMVLLCNAYNKRKITAEIAGPLPPSRNVGGMNIQQIETDFCMLGVVWAPNVPTSTIAVVDVAYCYPVFCPVPNKGLLFYEDKEKDGASIGGQIYGQIGIDYGPEEYHGKIINTATADA